MSATPANWNNLTEVAVGDWLVAYLKPSTFYAVGEVIKPRNRTRHVGATLHDDTVARTVQERRHRFLEGVVRYSDAKVLYEDFTESGSWTVPVPAGRDSQPAAWHYPQRIDVREWELVVPKGVQLDGLGAEVAVSAIRKAALRISDGYFRKIVNALAKECFGLRDEP